MSLWDRFRRVPTPAEKSPVAPPPATPPVSNVERVRLFGSERGPVEEELTSILKSIRNSPEESAVIAELLNLRDALSEPLRLAVASIYAERGEPSLAELALEHANSSEAFAFRADLRELSGDLPGAVALIERALIRNFDFPGGRERLRRWRMSLGLDDGLRAKPTATVVAPVTDSPFVLIREIARGGAGAVYQAEDRELTRTIALKLYHDASRNLPQLLHEARVGTNVRGTGIVRVFDVDAAHGWIALEWCGGGSLRDRLRSTRAGDINLNWALPLADALTRVHSAGWVHLDVKPANVLFRENGDTVLADFGIARRPGDASVPGSFGYVSPERISGAVASFQDDVYGFGRVLEEALSAAPPELNVKWRSLMRDCLSPISARLPDARAIATRIRTELS